MNNVTPERKDSVLKSLALIGLLGVILFIAWVSVQIVAVFPTAVSSLASLADSVYNYNPRGMAEIKLEPTAESVETGSELNLVWDKRFETGTYAFTFLCEEGLSVEIKSVESTFQNAECGKSYTLGTVDNAQVKVNSEKKGQAPFTYTISYFKNNVYTPSSQSSQSVLVTNSRFTESGPNVNVVNIPESEEEPGTQTETEVEVETPAVVTKPKPQPTYEVVYQIPVSDPNGFTDLKVTYLGIGSKNRNGSFTNSGTLKEGVAGVVQFSVQNLGTKTSDTWSFEAELPGGTNYTSRTQNALKPNERVIFTLTFPALGDTSVETFGAEATVEGDTNTKNNSFTWTTVVLK